MPLASIATIASSRAASSGSARSSMRTSPGAWNVTALIEHHHAGSESYSKNPAPVWRPRRPTEPERAERRGRAVALLAPLLVQRVEHAQHVVEPDLVGPREGPARVVERRGSCRCRCRRPADAFAERERRLVDTWQTIRPSTRPGASPTQTVRLPSVAKQPLRRRGGRVRGGRASGELDEPSLVEWRQHVEADRGFRPGRASRASRQRRGSPGPALRAAPVARLREHASSTRNGTSPSGGLRRPDVPPDRRGRIAQLLGERAVAGDHEDPVAPGGEAPAARGLWVAAASVPLARSRSSRVPTCGRGARRRPCAR